MDLSNRVTELEIQLAHQQRLCEQLNEVVTDHTQQIIRLERIIVRLEIKSNRCVNSAKKPSILPWKSHRITEGWRVGVGVGS